MPHFETRPSFLHWNSAKLFAPLKAPVFITWSQCVPCVSMLQRTRHASMASTCATPCNAMLHCFHSKHLSTSWDLLRFAFSTGSSSFVLKNTEFQSAACFRHLCAPEWLKKMFADKTELYGENEMQSETTRKPTSLLLAPLLQRGPGGLAESLTSHWDAWSCKRLSYTYKFHYNYRKFTTQWW